MAASPLLNVLVVDDEALIRWSLRRGFLERGHHVTEAASGSEALAMLGRDTAFDVVILDYHLPDRHDLTLLDDVRRLSPGSTVLMMTAYADEGVRTEAHLRGAAELVSKPFQVRALVSLAESTVRP